MPTRIVHVVFKYDTDSTNRAEIAAECMNTVEDALASFYGGHRGGWHGFNKVNGQATHSISVEGAHTLPNADEEVSAKPRWGDVRRGDLVESRGGAGQPKVTGVVIGIDGQHIMIQTNAEGVRYRTISNVRRVA